MTAPKLSAFVDEYGNHSMQLSAEDISSVYILAAIIVPTEQVQELTAAVESVRKTHFQTGELRSKKVAQNDGRRHKVLDALLSLQFKCFFLIVDKRRLDGKGYHYKQSFFKNLNGKLHARLFRLYPEIRILADEYGGSDFMRSFIDYVAARHEPDLFNRSGVEFVNSKNCVLVQLADFLAGTVARGFDQKKLSDPNHRFLTRLRASNHLIGLEHFPPETYDFENTEFSANEEFDPQIAQLAYNSARSYMKDHEKSDELEEVARLEVLEFFITHYHYALTNDYIETHTLIHHISETVGLTLSEQQFRSKIIGKLRDARVLISSSKRGYKIPSSRSDIDDFIKHQHRIVAPMISRVRKCHEQVLAATMGHVNILAAPELDYLRHLIEYQQAPTVQSKPSSKQSDWQPT